MEDTVTKKFPKEDLKELIGHKAGQGFESYKMVKDEMIDHRRWSIGYLMVFESNGKLYSTTYSVGATESQDETPFEYDDDEIECTEVVAVEKTIIDYIPVKATIEKA